MKTDCSQKQLLNRIDQVSFAVNDMTLYLDTHPCDEKALTYCHELVQERKKAIKRIRRSIWSPDYRHYRSDRRIHLEMDGTAIPMGKGRSVQIIYVEL